ncbi:hypothetical protein PFISCL1PPCAC_8050, partial [Pristionchus fissidentatus]
KMLATAHSGFTLLNFEGDVSGVSVVVAMTRGKETTIVGRVPSGVRRDEHAANIDFVSIDNENWKKNPRSITVLASLNEQLIDRGVSAVAREIMQLTKSTTVIGLVYGEMTSLADFNQLTSIATRIGFIEEREGRISARVRTVRKNGLIEEKRFVLSRGAHGGLIEEREKKEEEVMKIVERVEEKKEEKKEMKRGDDKMRRMMENPFEAAKSEDGLVAIHHGKVRVGGRIIYSADDADDLDDSDPDDDLHI